MVCFVGATDAADVDDVSALHLRRPRVHGGGCGANAFVITKSDGSASRASSRNVDRMILAVPPNPSIQDRARAGCGVGAARCVGCVGGLVGRGRAPKIQFVRRTKVGKGKVEEYPRCL